MRPGIRKERRKAIRVQKKVQQKRPRIQPDRKTSRHLRDDLQPLEETDDDSDENEDLQPVTKVAANASKPKSILKRSTEPAKPKSIEQGLDLEYETSLPKVSRKVRERLAKDDAEIAALEKALGLKGKKRLPKSFQDDGLDVLLDGLDGSNLEGESHYLKKRKADEDAWLQAKREKALKTADSRDVKNLAHSEGSSAEESDELLSDADDSSQPGLEDFEGFDSDAEDSQPFPRRVRENPYVAPLDPSTTSATKYIPPSKRQSVSSDSEDLQRLRRQVQGLLNRLSEANLATILVDIEKLYRLHPRQNMSSTLLDLLIGLLCDPTSLSDTFVILHAGFVAAIYRQIGTDFGAQAVQRIVEDFDVYSAIELGGDTNGKRLTNLISLVAELYNFKVIGSNLVFDFLRLFLGDLSETNTELILKIVRNAGPQLRQDDPSALKDIVFLLQSAVKSAGADSLSVRAKFMVETVNDLKNNRMKAGLTASSVASEHVTRMRKILGSLNTRNAKASEPLRIGLKDIRESDKRGKWWLVGASYRDDQEEKTAADDIPTTAKDLSIKDVSKNDDPNDLLQLARDHRMNTDIRRSIFVTIMSATDYRDAHLRLLKLRLKRTQELEIPRVLIHCARAEAVYNPYYTLIAKRLCTDKKLKMAFQFSLWDMFKLMGEGDEEVAEEDDRDKLGLREVVNLAKMFGMLVADGGLALSILKVGPSRLHLQRLSCLICSRISI